MNISDFIYYCIDPGLLTVEIYSLEKGETVWTGDGDGIPEEYEYSELCSWDVPSEADTITLNID